MMNTYKPKHQFQNKCQIKKLLRYFFNSLLFSLTQRTKNTLEELKSSKPQIEFIPTNDNDGLTIIILTYNRIKGLNSLLRSILRQELTNFNIEVIIANNYSGNDIKKKIDKILLHELQSIADVKMLDSRFNWKTRMRYALAALAKNERILFLDDDVVLNNPGFIRYMWDTFKNLQEFDLLSCWCTIWTECLQNQFACVGLNFNLPEITNLTQCDIAGPGICMFNRKLILNPIVFDTVTARNYDGSSDMLFSLIASMQMNSKSYYLPSHSMLDFHQEFDKNAMHKINNFYANRHRVYKILYEKGYIPVIERAEYKANTPEHYAVKTLISQTQSW